ncbi:hypothetical protein PPERSA_00270 [Pseudocohnilembus persalinus]|uniref:Uncharacterized protein n=1 Tax=Pseudocohnilembus persalinus TaxID=266149 RepID=A0A0V0Q942_PSEPJ|nr:hypothetical protein PPERSA_00270 [Pseudocohnilembus persalinus]|eukprot:KRW98682.1 hypothetical protein PPERSA_00270 [Pseudocohnilembus persalinus]
MSIFLFFAQIDQQLLFQKKFSPIINSYQKLHSGIKFLRLVQTQFFFDIVQNIVHIFVVTTRYFVFELLFLQFLGFQSRVNSKLTAFLYRITGYVSQFRDRGNQLF